MKRWITFTSSVFLWLAFFTSHSLALADKDGPKIGAVPPALTLTKTIQGLSTSELNWEKLKGKVVVLEFWATWCGPCVRSIPHLNDLAEQFKDRPVVFISVTSENEDVVRIFLKTHTLKASVGIDDYEVLNKAFHVQGIPHAVIVDATGHIAAIAHPKEIAPKNLNEVLAGTKCSLPEPAIYTVEKSATEVVPNEAPALFEISIREHKMPAQISGPICMWSTDTNGFEGKIATVDSALRGVFDKSSSRMTLNCTLPKGYYDFKLRAPPGHLRELQKEFIAALRTSFHLDVRQSTKETSVYVLTQVNTNAPGLKRVEKSGGGGEMRGGFRLNGSPLKGVAFYLENALGKSVLDETGLQGFYYADMKWKLSGGGASRPNPEAVIAAARERLGLQLTPARKLVEILEVNDAPE